MAELVELIPPENFAMVENGIYRGGFPKKRHFPFMAQLGLKSILTLVLEDYPAANVAFNRQHGVKLLQFGVPGNKEPFVDIPEEGIAAALAAALDPRNHPMYVHCNKGKHRTGCLIGCLRKVQNWAYSSIFDEYIRFSAPKARQMDQQFIELFRTERVNIRHALPRWPGLPDAPRLCGSGDVAGAMPLLGPRWCPDPSGAVGVAAVAAAAGAAAAEAVAAQAAQAAAAAASVEAAAATTAGANAPVVAGAAASAKVAAAAAGDGAAVAARGHPT